MFLFNKILPNVVAEVRNAYNLDLNNSTLACATQSVIQAFDPIHHSILCNKDRPVQPVPDAKHFLLVEKISWQTFKVTDSTNVREIYKLQHPPVN
ncbi:uncharacterized protein LOC116853369 isoform X2 [Odontomachus brunneus]|uniref:uncharacterized protein LOC116853369 isoform X2 n=1 Tax=Odontomachus brunneus TaxID=486640 RepID=UPI0013F27168|nr:uncharacterized protein LOC116853369 isoform X2 [Odontomachus brunneus]